MFNILWHTIIYNPLYNALIFLLDIVPGADIGIAVIILTVFVKVLLFPLAHKVARTQATINQIQPQLDKLKDKYKDNKQEQTIKTLELYKKNGINPFFGFLVILIQLPIILGLYFVFYKGGLPSINMDIL
jgi:YidC/Oxa1 family membrane protein insertase